MIIDDIIINLLIIFFIYLVVFAIYYAFMVSVSTKKNQIGLEQKYIAEDLLGNIIVIIYADSADYSVVKLVEALKKQKYPKENYQLHVIFDNVSDEVTNVVQQQGDVKVWKINKGVPMGKDEAVSWLLEKLISFRNVNAFVFLNSDRMVKEDFLEGINKALFYSDAVVPANEYIDDNSDIIVAVKNHVAKYVNRIFNTSRAVLRLINPVDDGAFAIKQEVLEQIKQIDLEDKKSAFKYTVFLANKGYFPIFAPDVIVKKSFEKDFGLSFKDKIEILKYSCSNVLGSNMKLFEFVSSFLKPSAGFVLFLYLVFFTFLYNFEVKNMFFYDSKCIAFAAVSTLIILFISLGIAMDNKVNPVFILLSPLYRILEVLFVRKKTKLSDNKTQNFVPDSKGNVENVQVSDANNILNCSIEIKTTENGKMAIFRYKDKKMESAEYMYPQEAIQEIAEKLKSNGLKLQVCASCCHFGFKPDGDRTKQTGLCSCKEKMTEDIQSETKLLNTCEYFKTFADLNNVVDFPRENNE